MKIKHILFTCLFLITCAAVKSQTPASTDSAADDRGYLVKVGDEAPADFELVLSNGTKTSLKDLRGKVVILQFTASWCSVCREEMPHLEKDIWQAYKDKGLVLIGVDRDEPINKVNNFHKEMKISYPLALDPGADIFGRFASKKSGVTRNVVINRDGKIVYLTRLYDKKEFSSMVKAVDALVNTKIASAN